MPELSEGQQGYMKRYPDCVVTETDDEGWIFVEQERCVGQEGSGVWVDPQGREHYGPAGNAA